MSRRVPRPATTNRFRILVLLVFSGLGTGLAPLVRSESSTTAGEAGFAIFDQPGTYQWTRPKDVSWVLVRGSGGGGGGAGGGLAGQNLGQSIHRCAPGGGGGAGAALNTYLFGPLTEDSYAVVVGAAGVGGQGLRYGGGIRPTNGFDGQDSFFSNVRFPGGQGGSLGPGGVRGGTTGGHGGFLLQDLPNQGPFSGPATSGGDSWVASGGSGGGPHSSLAGYGEGGGGGGGGASLGAGGAGGAGAPREINGTSGANGGPGAGGGGGGGVCASNNQSGSGGTGGAGQIMIAWAPFTSVARMVEQFEGLDQEIRGLPAQVLQEQTLRELETRLHQYIDERCGATTTRRPEPSQEPPQ